MEAADLLLWFRTISLALAGVIALAFGTGINAASRSPGSAAPAHPSPPLGAGAGAAGGTAGARGTVAPALVNAGTAVQVVTHGSVVSADQMSPDQLAGQRVIYSYSGLRPPASLLALIRQGRAAGVIFFGGNYRDSGQFRAAIRALEAANASTTNPARRYPLLLMTDQEGGEVNRLPGAPAASEKQIGALRPLADASAAASRAGTEAAANLAGRGLNVDLSPVLDVYRTARDFDDRYHRSFSRDPAIVSALGARFISAMQARHVAATAKHFPGLGAANARQDTDSKPVTIGLSAAELAGVDEYPFPAAIAAGVHLVMLSWAVYPQLGSARPAGLSSPIVTGLLRGKLGFQGVTITDAIGAGALRSYGPVPRRAELAAAAGEDLILASSQSAAEGEQAAAGLAHGYSDGALSRASAAEAVERILSLRASLGA